MRNNDRESLLGKKFGKLTVVSFKEINKWGQTRWLCQCDCGNTTTALISPLKSGGKRSCGCLDKLKGKDKKTWRGHEDISLSRFNKIKSDAQKRNLEFSISIQGIWELYLKQDKKCAISGLELTFGLGKFDPKANASLDRIDSSKGYISGNIQWVDKRINFMKQSYSMDDFCMLCKKVSDNCKNGLVIK